MYDEEIEAFMFTRHLGFFQRPPFVRSDSDNAFTDAFTMLSKFGVCHDIMFVIDVSDWNAEISVPVGGLIHLGRCHVNVHVVC